MANAVYHYIENYSNVGKIGIAYSAICDMLNEAIKDVEHVSIHKGINCEVNKEKRFVVDVSVKIDYGSNINEISKEIQEKIDYALTNMCEINNSIINIKLEGIMVK